ncbi:MAG: peptide chain release factor-like protein [Phycisphaerales bacterium]|nr:peptide chain release factor-like protein [Phycisphaerales bacterium]
MTYRPPFVSDKYTMVDSPHPATLLEDDLLKQCDFRTGRTGGPGGQHRNTTESGIHVTHEPTGIGASAGERRHQAQNKHMAIKRLRLKLAAQCRCPGSRDRHQPSALWTHRRAGNKMSVNPEHSDYPALLSEALDVIVARRFDVAGAAGALEITMSQLSRLVRAHRTAFERLNQCREEIGLPRLRS